MTDVVEPGFDGEYEPSPDARVREQVRAYEASGGTEGGTLEDKPVVILTTVDSGMSATRLTRLVRTVPLEQGLRTTVDYDESHAISARYI